MTKKKHAPRGYRSPGTGGGPPGMPGMSGGARGGNMIAQIQQLQQEMEAAQSSLSEVTVEASAGGGVVNVVANGQQEIVSITLKPEVVDPDDVDMLQDLILSAVNQALDQSRQMASERMSGLTQGLNLPPGIL
ncbi:MAG: YbaB/EbfC family nucleoid-associated protein [Caldilineales bacterium]|nr:YbaB/EbfC family nucleoid-associated protein [Caldilineales bacterium]MCW5860252.1 YbaB/EbfC family nucleoid-associated protein [Caldilineales bacterium]